MMPAFWNTQATSAVKGWKSSKNAFFRYSVRLLSQVDAEYQKSTFLETRDIIYLFLTMGGIPNMHFEAAGSPKQLSLVCPRRIWPLLRGFRRWGRARASKAADGRKKWRQKNRERKRGRRRRRRCGIMARAGNWQLWLDWELTSQLTSQIFWLVNWPVKSHT